MSKRLKRMRLRLLIPFAAAALGMFLLCGVLRAQLKPMSNTAPRGAAAGSNLNDHAKSLETLKVNVNLVSLYFTVHDKNGALISTLTKDDFAILEDGVPQTIKNFEAESDQPLSLGILLDTSGSQKNVMPLEQKTGSAFLKRVLRATDEAFLLSFDVDVDLLVDYTSDPRALEHAMNNAQIHIAAGNYRSASEIPGTVLYDAVYLAARDMLAQKTGRKVLIILSDGEDQGSQANLEDAIEFAQRVNCPVYMILIADRSYYAQRVGDHGYPKGYTGGAAMAKLAEETGGRVINVGNDGKKLEAAFDSIAQELRTEYVASYTPTNGKMDGSYRRLDVNVNGDGLNAQVRKGYYAVPVPVRAPISADCQRDVSRSVPGGGISVPGWDGSVDPELAQAGQTIKDAKLWRAGDVLHVATGPAVTYWSPANKASGDYTVSATFTEPKYMNLNSHPHPYGVFIAGNDMGTAQQSELYCAAYGDGNFIVRGFGPKPFQMNGQGSANAAVHKASAPGQSVSQKIALSVKDGLVECAINGSVVASYPKSQLVMAGKLKSTDGVYGMRFAQNTDGTVTHLKIEKHSTPDTQAPYPWDHPCHRC